MKETDLDAFLRKRLAVYKVPSHYEFRNELPKSAVGKVLKRRLIEEERAKTDVCGDKTDSIEEVIWIPCMTSSPCFENGIIFPSLFIVGGAI